VRQYEAGPDAPGKLAQVPVVPRGFGASVQGWNVAFPVPADAEAVTVCRLHSELGVKALVDQRVSGLVEQVVKQDRASRVCEPTAHDRSLLWMVGERDFGLAPELPTAHAYWRNVATA